MAIYGSFLVKMDITEHENSSYTRPQSVTSVTTVTRSLEVNNNLKEQDEIPNLKSLLFKKQNEITQRREGDLVFYQCPHPQCRFENMHIEEI
jgi:hypothetical protein